MCEIDHLFRRVVEVANECENGYKNRQHIANITAELVSNNRIDRLRKLNEICKKHSPIPEYRIGETETKFNIEVICPGLNRKNLSLTEENRTLKIDYKHTDCGNLYNPDSFTINHRIPHDSDINNIS